MFKRIALAALLLVATALSAHVRADDCEDEDCSNAWEAAITAQTGAGQDKGWAEGMRDVADEFRAAVAYCYANHGGATSEDDYQSAMTDAQYHIDVGDLAAAAAAIFFAQGDYFMVEGNLLCPGAYGSATRRYGFAKERYDGASTSYSNAWDQYLEAVWDCDAAAGYLVGEIDGNPCGGDGCNFEW